jgi:hypothetical protein
MEAGQLNEAAGAYEKLAKKLPTRGKALRGFSSAPQLDIVKSSEAI